MRSIGLRVTLFTLVFAISSLALADQKVKTKSNIKNDRVAGSSSSASCADEKEGSADGKTACKTIDPKSSASSVANTDAKDAEQPKP